MRGVCLIGIVVLPLSACAELNVVHDPQTGVIDKDKVTSFVKSIRCELITFYDANAQRRRKWRAAKDADREEAFLKYSHFDLDPRFLGAVFLDLKITDTLGFPSGSSSTSIDPRRIFNALHSQSWHFGPSLNTQNYYGFNWGFLIAQNAELYSSQAKKDPYSCYSVVPDQDQGAKDYDGLAEGKFRHLEQFDRILVNGVTPLAAWLQGVGTQLWPTWKSKIKEASSKEQLYPVQMTYTFQVSFNAGLDAKYSLLYPQWNPLAISATASTQQTSNISIVMNGTDARLALAARNGQAILNAAGLPGGVQATEPGVEPGGGPAERSRKTQPPSSREEISGSKGFIIGPPLPLSGSHSSQ